jgi:hypothetical protein
MMDMHRYFLHAKQILMNWLALILMFIPGSLKNPIYRRVYGYKIGKHVHIGLVLFWGVGKLYIGNQMTIRHLTRFQGIPEVEIGDYTSIGMGNTFTLTSEFTSLEAIAQRGNCPKFVIGEHCGIAMLHYFDVQDIFIIGAYTLVASNPAAVVHKLPMDAAYFHRNKGAVLSFTRPINEIG